MISDGISDGIRVKSSDGTSSSVYSSFSKFFWFYRTADNRQQTTDNRQQIADSTEDENMKIKIKSMSHKYLNVWKNIFGKSQLSHTAPIQEEEKQIFK